MDKMLNTLEAADLIGAAPGTLENWRTQGRGPAYVKLPGRRGKVLYDPCDIERWRDSLKVPSSSEATNRDGVPD